MSSVGPDVLVTISSLEHYAYCPKQCALMYVEGIWVDDVNTVAGTILHDHVDSPGWETDGEKKTLRALPLFSKKHGLVGKADLVEIHENNPIPVEYKKGRKSKWAHDEIQLCAQALCLEEMFRIDVPKGYIYHAGSKRRREVVFDNSLRKITIDTIEAVRDLLREQKLPRAILGPKCQRCSLHSICLPELTDNHSKGKQDHYSQLVWEG